MLLHGLAETIGAIARLFTCERSRVFSPPLASTTRPPIDDDYENLQVFEEDDDLREV